MRFNNIDILALINKWKNKIINKLYRTYTTFFQSFFFKLYGIKYGKGLSCRGFMIVSRYPKSCITIGNNCSFNSNSRFNYRGINHPCILQTGKSNAQIIIGDNCGFSGVSIVSDNKVIIGNNVLVGANSLIGDRDDHSNIYPSLPQSVIIGDNTWIGMNVIILKGVKIGRNCIVGAGSIVTKDIPDNTIAAGNPCKVIKNR